MARKPTRFWHPARRLLLRAQENARTLVTSHDITARLEDVRPRLQHYLRAMYGEGVTIESIAPPKKPGAAVRALKTLALVRERGASESDASCMRLPAQLPIQRTSVPPLDQYRVIAVQHAERMRRESARHARDVTTDLEHDLYQLAESITIDAQIVATQPGLRPALDAARTEANAQRVRPRWRTDIELRVEDMFRKAWSANTNTASDEVDLTSTLRDNDAESNATWARRTANALEAKFGRKAARAYRRVPELTLWQTTVRSQLPEQQQYALETEQRQAAEAPKSGGASSSSSSMMPGGAQSKNAPNKPSSGTAQSDSGKTSAQEKSDGAAESNNSQSSGDRAADSSADTNADSASKSNDNQEPSQQAASAQAGDGANANDQTQVVSHSSDTVADDQLAGIAYHYPEWDFSTRDFRATGTTVRVMPPSLGTTEWGRNAVKDHAREASSAKRQFERLRSHRLRLRRQVQGDELDLEACVDAMVDRRMGVAPTDRLYSLVRPGRRELAITLLIDVSGSTGDAVDGAQRVIDIERISAMIATAAFDALGDDYSILAFSSASASNVRVHTLKEFGEPNSPIVLQRIGALAPHGTTRLGAAVRHATATLGRHPAPHRLLLILSDGKPYDYDWYWTDYAIQDSRHAVMSARLQGIHPFCITVDTADEESYLAEIFGSAGYRVVTKPSQLSQALLVAVQRMIGGAG